MKLPAILLLLASVCIGSMSFARQKPEEKTPPPQNPRAEQKQDDFSGMYSFLREGEFVQIDVEGQNRIGGFISRYGDTDSDRGEFLDQLIDQGTLEGRKIAFTTREVHGIKYEFKGTISRGEARQPGAEGYWLIKGTLTEISTDAEKKTSSRSREVTLKSFPTDESAGTPKKD